MSERPFVHLHCHSHYSLLDGAGAIGRLVNRAAELGMNALALTDHGNLHGALEFYRKAIAAGVKPIIGYEAYVAPGSRFEKGGGKIKDSNYHLTMLAMNRTGFNNLVKLASFASLEGFYFRPRIDRELLKRHNEGIICLSGCASSQISRLVLTGNGTEESIRQAIDVASWYRDLLGDRYYIELQNNGLDIQRRANAGAMEVARRLDIPVVATSDTHYVLREDAEAQDVMTCISTGKFRTDVNRMRMETNEFYLRSPEEMYEVFSGNEEAVRCSQDIADRVDIELELGNRHFPTYAIPKGTTAEDFLRERCIEGLKDRYANEPEMYRDGKLSDVVMTRLDRELGVINKLGFPNYFLIVWDFVHAAREQGIPTTARGSGVGALVCFALYLSHVCPIKYDLLFERFLDENRLEAPDIDIDFCKERRGWVIQYVKEKYGEENVAQIGTFGTLAARAAIKDVGRVLGIPLNRVNEVTGMVPDELGISLKKAIAKSEDLKKNYNTDRDIHEMLDLAMNIEGLARNVGTHAAAVVIADKPLTEYVPLGRVPGKTDIITQWAMKDVEDAGLLKMDFLGLRNLTILSKATELVEKTTGNRIDPQTFPLDDEETFALLRRGETKGVFQLESGGIRSLLQRMRPDHFHDIIATNALYRPGPLEGGMVDEYIMVKHGEKAPEYKHPVLEKILEETNGVMVYQEQVMRILNQMGGIELASAYTCIKAISKKKEELIERNREQFLKGATEQGLSSKDALDFWEMILKFAGYGFNKSHSTAYALIAYQTAYLKAHYPVEFMAALLTSDIPNRNFKQKDSLVEHLEDCDRMEIEVVAPSINTSGVEFDVTDDKIQFALAAIKGCGGSAAEAIVTEREKNGSYKDLFDFCERVEANSCNRAAIETLIKAGAFDFTGARREQLAAVVENALAMGAAAQADRRSGQKNLFELFGGESGGEDASADTPSELPHVPERTERELLAEEKEVLGFYLSSHPLAEYAERLETFCSHTTTRLRKVAEREQATIGGILSAIKTAHTKKPKEGTPSKYANFDLEDRDGIVRCIMWPRDYEKYHELVAPDSIVVARGRVDRRGGDEINFVVNELTSMENVDARPIQGLALRLHETVHGPEMLSIVREILRAYPGDLRVQLSLILVDGSSVLLNADGVHIDLNAELRRRLDEALGASNVKVLAGKI